MAISSPGIGSGLDITSIVTQLMNVEKQPLDLLDQKEASFQAQLSAYGNLRGALASFQSAVTGLDNVSKFRALKATTSDSAVLTAAAADQASIGTHAIGVSQLAQSQSLVAAGQSSATAAIGSGASTTLTFDFGTISGGSLASGVYTGATFVQDATQPSGTVTIDGTNNSLTGIRDAINAAHIGVIASVINDGSNTPYRLALTAASTGASHSVRIGVSGDASLQTLLSYDAAGTQNLTQTVTAQDAKLTVDGVAVSSTSNVVGGAVEGVTLSLVTLGSSVVNITRDAANAKSAIQDFVKAYDDFAKTIGDLTKFDSSGSGKSGALLGDAAARTLQSQLRNALSESLPGLGVSNLSSLSAAGISFQRDGTLAIDDGKLSAALNGNADDIAALFTSVGRASDSLVRFNNAGKDVQPGTYQLSVTALATQGKLVGSAPAVTTINAGVNDQLAISIDGISATVTLTPGTYTAAALAAQVQAAVNGASALSSKGVGVLVTEAGGTLTITSGTYGSTSSVSASGTAASTLLGSAPSSTAGTDVAGAIGGFGATGSGQTLTSGGLAVQIVGGSTGSRGTISFTRGYAQRLDALLDDVLSAAGLLAGRTDGINRSIKDLDQQRDRFNQRLTTIEARYRAQFTALDTLLSSMQTTSTFLTQQLNVLNGTSASSKK